VFEQQGTFKSLACNGQKVTESCTNTAKWEHENLYCFCIDQVKEDKVCGICVIHGEYEICLQHVSCRTSKDGCIWEGLGM